MQSRPIRVVVLASIESGSSNFILRQTDASFSPGAKTSIGLDFKMYEPPESKGQKV
jgi:hypothetical protein